MPNVVGLVELTAADLHPIGFALHIAHDIVAGKSEDIDGFEEAVTQIEQSGPAWDNMVRKMRDATVMMANGTAKVVDGYA